MLSLDFQTKFYNMPLSFWTEYHSLHWKYDKNYLSFTGAEIRLFINNLSIIAIVLRNNLVITQDIDHICKGVELWNKIASFLKITIVKDEDKYPTLTNKVEDDIIEFYKYEKHKFPTERNIGDN